MSHAGTDDDARGGRGSVAGRHRRRMRPILLVLEDRRLLSTFTVTNTADSGTGSLRWAVGQANSAGGADTIDFDSTVFNTPRTITLTSGPLVLDITSGTETISGPGAGLLSISGNHTSRVFYIVNNE